MPTHFAKRFFDGKMNYRELYEKTYNIKIPHQYDIHHIDLNHNNNVISNLMILPHELHEEYHKAIKDYEYDKQFISIKIKGYQPNSERLAIDRLEYIISVLHKCDYWYDYKMYIEGKIPNIHNIKL